MQYKKIVRTVYGRMEDGGVSVPSFLGDIRNEVIPKIVGKLTVFVAFCSPERFRRF
ncbi:MAG: hypothetical protein IKK51_08470 [Oscillospiraceae bacterium]|nr:hypothetical protein [Oscillospiraceae bacterium]